MKTSKKIIFGVAGFLILMLVVSLFVLKNDMRTLLENQMLLTYEEIPVDNFNNVTISANWTVQVKQGKNHKLELASESGDHINPNLNNENGTLYLSVEETPEHNTAARVHARITAPNLQTIRAEGNSHIEMRTFWSDSIIVILDDSATYVGNNLDFKRIHFKSSGK